MLIMKTKILMKKQGLRYFSSLNPLQKDKTILNIRILKNGLQNLPNGLAVEILNNKDFESNIKEIDFINNLIQGQKIFKHKDNYYPLNIEKILKS